jgi:hypothetical protein
MRNPSCAGHTGKEITTDHRDVKHRRIASKYWATLAQWRQYPPPLRQLRLASNRENTCNASGQSSHNRQTPTALVGFGLL